MARKILNRKELRAENDAAESAEADEKKVATKKKTAAPKRKSRKKVAAEVRLKAFWGIYNQSLKCVAKFEYSQKKAAQKKAEELTGTSKSPHFVQLLKETIEEA